MQRLLVPVLAWLTVIAGAHGFDELGEDLLTDRTHPMQRIHVAADLDESMLGKRALTSKVEYKAASGELGLKPGRVYQPPLRKPSLYSQGYLGKKEQQAPLVKTYKPPVDAQRYNVDDLPKAPRVYKSPVNPQSYNPAEVDAETDLFA